MSVRPNSKRTDKNVKIVNRSFTESTGEAVLQNFANYFDECQECEGLHLDDTTYIFKK